MYVTTVMVVIMIGGAATRLPCAAGICRRCRACRRSRTRRTRSAGCKPLGLPYTVSFIGILIGLGHSVLAMSGEETMAQVYREIEHPKLKNLEKAGFVIFLYSLIFTAGTAFFVVMIIPDAVRGTLLRQSRLAV